MQHLSRINIPLQEQTTHNRRHTNWRHRPHRHTNRQEKCWKRPTDQGNTLDQHTIIRTKWRNQQNPSTKETHNTTQHNPHPIPPAQTPPQKNQLYPRDQWDTNNTYHTKSIWQIPNPTSNPHNPNTNPPQQQLTNELMTVQDWSLFDQVHFQLLWSSGTPERLQSWYLCRSDRPFAVEHTR